MTKKKRKSVEDMFPEAFTVRNNIEMLSKMQGVTEMELAEAVGTSRETLRRRRKQPWKYTEYEKKIIADTLHTTVGALYSDMREQFAAVIGS